MRFEPMTAIRDRLSESACVEIRLIFEVPNSTLVICSTISREVAIMQCSVAVLGATRTICDCVSDSLRFDDEIDSMFIVSVFFQFLLVIIPHIFHTYCK